jgi:hypothetical protein
MDHDMLDAGRPGSRRSVEDPRVAIGRAVARAIFNSPLNAALREFPVRILKSVESQLKPFRDLSRQFLEAAELLGAIDAFQRGEKDQLRKWIDERYGVRLDPVLGAKLRRNIPKIADNPDADAGTMITLARHWMHGNKKRLTAKVESSVWAAVGVRRGLG